VPLDGSDRLRGHGALLGAVDTTISVTKGADGIRSGSVVKANDSDEGESVSFTLESVEIGQDEEGNKTAAPIVIPSATTERTQPRPSYSLPKAARTALRALAEAIDECGEPAPASNHIPQGVKVTTVDNWRHYAYRRGISPSEKPRARQAAFKRASEHLVGIEAAVIWDDYVWEGC
jgi:hypothetical protein